MQEKGVRLHAIGDLSRLPKRTQKLLQSSLEATAGNTRLNLVLALSYGSRAEIAAAARKIAEKASRGELHPDAVTEDLFNQHLDTAGMPEPGPAHPHLRGNARLQLPAVADQLCGTLCNRNAVAGLQRP